MRRFIAALILVAAGAATLFMISSRPAPPSSPQVETIVPVEVREVHPRVVAFTVASQGTVQPRTETTLAAEVSGTVKFVSEKLYAGGFFRQGEVLLTLDSADYEVAVAQAEAAVLAAQAQLAQEQAQAEQMGREWDLSGRPRSQAPAIALRTPFLKEAEARVLSAQADLERTQRQLERTIIRAPFDGIVREKFADIGRYVSTGSQVATLFSTDYAEVRLPLSESDLRWLELPMPGRPQKAPDQPLANLVDVTLSTASINLGSDGPAGTPAQQWRGHIVRMEGVVDTSSRMHYAVARVQDPYALAAQDAYNAPLAIGSFVNATLHGIQVPGIFTLPHSAMRDGNQVLLMDAEQRLRQVSVNIVRSDTQSVYIDQGLASGDQVIVSPVQIPIEGMKVNPVARQDQP